MESDEGDQFQSEMTLPSVLSSRQSALEEAFQVYTSFQKRDSIYGCMIECREQCIRKWFDSYDDNMSLDQEKQILLDSRLFVAQKTKRFTDPVGQTRHVFKHRIKQVILDEYISLGIAPPAASEEKTNIKLPYCVFGKHFAENLKYYMHTTLLLL